MSLPPCLPLFLSSTTARFPDTDPRCPHYGACSATTGCHAGTVPHYEAKDADESGGIWRALEWMGRGPAGVRHRAPEPVELDRPPKHAMWRRIQDGDGWALFVIAFEVLAAHGVTGVRYDRRLGALIVLGLEPMAVVRLEDSMAGELPAGFGMRVRRAVAR